VAGQQLSQTFFYADGTRRLSRALVDRNVAPLHIADINTSYDPAGNVTRIADTPAGGAVDTQCFGYDYLRRLTRAWTANGDCTAAPSSTVIGGPAPYWQSWTYDKTGNRRSETNYNPATATSTTSTYTYPATGALRPHALSTLTTNAAANSYGYDAAGNTTGRTVGGSQQTLTWDAEGHLASVVEAGRTTSFLYDADGARLVRREADATTLYLGATELRLATSLAVSATRVYNVATATAVRSATGLSFEVTDPHGTATLAVDADDLSVTQRRYLPFGEVRGPAAASWPDQKGYVGGINDTTTGLTHLGAREYDADTGRFISVDPVIDFDDPQQMNAYAYANNTPVTAADADGMYYCDSCDTARREKAKKAKAHKAKKKAKKKTPVYHYYCDSCDTARRAKQKKASAARARKHKQPVYHYYCDSCDTARRAREAKAIKRYSKDHFCDGCNRYYAPDEEGHRRWAKQEAARQAREAAEERKHAEHKSHGFLSWLGHAAHKAAECFLECYEKAEHLIAPLILAGATIAVGYGLILACTTLTLGGCLVAAPLLIAGTAAGAYSTYRVAKAMWVEGK
jgi:RHS repeat-associated protein